MSFIIIPKLAFADGESWLTGWSYRKSHIIEYASGADTNYQVKIIIDYSSGSDSGDTVYVNGKCQIDFDDIRFTDNDGDTELDYWLEVKVDSDNAVFWVEITDNLSSVDVVIYVYYGNDAVSTTSDGEATFTIFDDFNDGSVDSAKWDSYLNGGTITETGGLLVLDDGGYVYSDMNVTAYDKRIHFRVEFEYLNCFMFAGLRDYPYTNELILVCVYGAYSEILYCKDDGNVNQFLNIYTDFTTMTVFDVLWSLDRCIFDMDFGNEIETMTVYVPDETMNLRFDSVSTYFLKIDYVFQSSYVYPEPVHDAWGEEEAEVEAFFITFQLVTGGTFEINGTVKTNSTVTEYNNQTVLVLKGVVENASYGWLNFTWISGNSTINNYNFIVSSNNTIWCYFDVIGIEGIHEDYFVLGFVISGCAVLFMVIVIKDKKEKEK